MERIEFRWFVRIGLDDPVWAIRASRRTASICWQARSPPSSSPLCCRSPGSSDCWDRDYLDRVEPAYLQIGREGWVEFAFGCVTAGGKLEYSQTIVFFRWGFDEGVPSACSDRILRPVVFRPTPS